MTAETGCFSLLMMTNILIPPPIPLVIYQVSHRTSIFNRKVIIVNNFPLHFLVIQDIKDQFIVLKEWNMFQIFSCYLISICF